MSRRSAVAVVSATSLVRVRRLNGDVDVTESGTIVVDKMYGASLTAGLTQDNLGG